MLFDSSTRKELGRSFGATLVVLITVVMTMMLIRTLGQATKGTVSPSDVLLVMGFTVLGHLPTILTLCLFIAAVSTLSRMYRDSEMAIWFSSGQGLASQLKPILRFAWPIIAVIALLALLVWPWSNQQIQELRMQYQERSDIDRIAPGEFQESSDGSRVIFIDKDSLTEESASNIFLVEQKNDRESITSSQSAQLVTNQGTRSAVLIEGQRVENNLLTQQIKLTHFERYELLLEEKKAQRLDVLPRGISTVELFKQPTSFNLGEAGWRIGLPFAALNLIVLALSITIVNPRAGQSTSLVVALLAFVVYYNLMSVGQSWVGSGRIHWLTYVLGLHGGVLSLAIVALAIRHHRLQFNDLWKRRGATA